MQKTNPTVPKNIHTTSLSNDVQAVNEKSNSRRAHNAMVNDQSLQQFTVEPSCIKPFQLSQDGNLLLKSILYGTAEKTISVMELLYPSEELNSIPEKKLKITLQPKDLQDLNRLLALLPKPNTNFFDKFTNILSDQPGVNLKIKFIDQIIGLDLSKLKVDKHTNEPINTLLTATLDKNLNFMSNLTNLTIGNIQTDLILPNGLHNLKRLTIGNFEYTGISIILPNGLNNLAELTIGDIRANVTLPSDLYNLTTLTIGSIRANCKLQSLLNNLTSITIGDIATNCDLTLLDDQDYSITTFTIGKVFGTLTLPPSSLNNLKILTIDFIGEANTLKLPNSLANLTTLTIRDIAGSVILPDSLANLSTLFIGEFRENAVLKLPNDLNNLTTLTIENIYNDASLELSTFLNSLTTLIVRVIGKNVTLKFPLTLNNLKSLTIGSIGQTIITATREKDADTSLTALILENTQGTKIKLPDSLPNLINIQVGTVFPGSTLALPFLIDLKLTITRIPMHFRFLLFFMILALGIRYFK